MEDHQEESDLFREYRQLLADLSALKSVLGDSAHISSNDVLIVVDMQNDFLPAAGNRFCC